MTRTLLVGLLALAFALTASAQTKKVPCYAGDQYPSCSPARALSNRRALEKAKTAAIIIEATQGIACGDGSDGCFDPF